MYCNALSVLFIALSDDGAVNGTVVIAFLRSTYSQSVYSFQLTLTLVCAGGRRPPPLVTSNRCISVSIYLSIHPSGFFFNSCRRLPETKRHSSMFLHWYGSKFLVVMAACTPSIHVYLGCPLFLLSRGIHSLINFGILSSGILLTWPYHCSLLLSMVSGFPFTPIISFVCLVFILSILDFLADFLSTSISVDKILFLSLVGICHTSAPCTKMLWIIVW